MHLHLVRLTAHHIKSAHIRNTSPGRTYSHTVAVLPGEVCFIQFPVSQSPFATGVRAFAHCVCRDVQRVCKDAVQERRKQNRQEEKISPAGTKLIRM